MPILVTDSTHPGCLGDRPFRETSMSFSATTVRGKVLASAALLGAAAGAAGLGTFGSFTSATSASAAVSSGTVSIALGAANTAANRFSVAATGLVPGDTVQ